MQRKVRPVVIAIVAICLKQ